MSDAGAMLIAHPSVVVLALCTRRQRFGPSGQRELLKPVCHAERRSDIFSWTRVAGCVWFGLVHGFGFANVLTELGLPRHALLLALVGFNLGVEAGQLAIASPFLPVACAMRSSRFYYSAVMKFGSVVIAVIAGLWFLERLFDWKILPV
jgi:hypothetical protein